MFAPQVGRSLQLMDQPDGERKLHRNAVPLVGGLAVCAALAAGIALFLIAGGTATRSLVIFGGVVSCVFVVGLLDDRYQLRPWPRLLISGVAVLLGMTVDPSFVVREFHFAFLPGMLPLEGVALAFSLVVVLGMINAVNMADGIDGLVPGLAIIWTGLLLYVGAPALDIVLWPLLAASTVVLAFNLGKRLFLGDAGSNLIAAAVSLAAIHAYTTADGTIVRPLYAEELVVWFLVPVADCLRLVAVRVARRRSPWAADRNHLHHRMARAWGHTGALIGYWALVGIPAVITFADASLAAPLAMGVLIVYASILAMTSQPRLGRRPLTSQ